MEPLESSPAAPVNERVYVAVGSNVEESKLTLQWALQNFGGDFRIIHVHSPYPSPEGPGPRSHTTKGDDISSMQEVLDEYVRICRIAKVSVERRWIEMRDIGKGIVELVEQHAVTKLVMGAGADKHYTEGMTELISSKAKFVEQHAHPSCYIWFVCNGHLIHVREGDLSTVDMDVAFPWLPAKSAVQTVQSSPRSTLGLAHFPSYSSEIEDDLPLVRYERGEGSGLLASSIASDSYEDDRQLALFQEENANDEVYEQLERAMAEAANAKREAYEELIRRQKAEKNFNDANRRVKMIEKLYSDETRRRKELEEVLAKERESFETLKCQQFEGCSAANDVRTSLESQLASHNHENRELQDKLASTEELLEVCNKALEETREHLENALKVNEELLTNQSGGEASTTQRHSGLMEFSFSEIQEATDNFDPSLKLEEGEYGSLYKGILRHTPVTIKMLHPDSSEGPSQYHREVEVVSKLRHPHLIALLGVCPEAWALIYEHPPNGSLEDCLGSGRNSTPLSWQNRIRISTEICSALIFLHSSGSDRVVHGNLIPKNILLDANSVSKLKDIRIQDPDASEASDVYSFGTILLQLLTGRSTLNLAVELQDALMGDINDMLDPTAGDWPFLETTQLAHLALSCCEVDGSIRPDLSSEVWEVLKSIRACCEVATVPTSQTVQNGTTEPPQYFLCPISYDIMEDPHVAADGFTYEASEIREWLNSGHDTSPMTNLQLQSGRLVPNLTLKTAIQEWLQNHPQHVQRSVSNS